MNDWFADRLPKALRMRQLVVATLAAAKETGSRRTAAAIVGMCLVPLLSGCIVGYEKPDPALDSPAGVPGGRPGAPRTAAFPALDWWRGFRSAELTALIEEAQTANLDIAAAVARIMQADAQARIAGAPLLPMSISTPAPRARGPRRQRQRRNRQRWTVRAHALQRLAQRQLRDRLLGQEPRDAARRRRRPRSPPASTARSWRSPRSRASRNTYFLVLAAQDRLRIARDNVRSATRILTLIRERLAAGTASALDVAQQESLVATQRAAIPLFEQLLRQNIATLAVLIGRAPEFVTIRGGSMSRLSRSRA